MAIAAHIESSAGTASYLAEYILRLAAIHPNHQFVIFSSKEASHGFKFPANCKLITVKPVIRNSLLLHYWYNYKLPKLLLRHNAFLFISESNCCSLRTQIAQVLLIRDLLFQPADFPVKNEYRFYFKRFFARFATKAKAILVTESFIETALLKQYPALSAKTTFIPHALPRGLQGLAPATPAGKEEILTKYTQGNEFFLCECSVFTEQSILVVLKAFSIFKRHLKSGMHLVFLNRLAEMPVKDFKNYKYRSQVSFVSNLTVAEEQAVLAAGYAAIYLPSFTMACNLALRCFQSAVPLITSSGLGYEASYHNAALYTAHNEKDIAACMMELYKNETYRNELIAAGATLGNRYNWEEGSGQLWQTISNYIPA